MTFRRLITCFATLLFAATAQLQAQAQDGKTILVFDASGSMWGQIDGKTKIEIAQSVVGGLLDDLPSDQVLGLTAYGHNRKGDCSDIETLVSPAPNSREAIRSAVNAIKPKGKTPLSEAVIQAAEALKYTEDKATVILISDGRETCDFDPCEVGRKLEESGVDFTAHVVGFDVANPADRAQLQCLAENTGGQFITASNASELSTALQQVSVPEPPKPRDITFAALIEGTTTQITADLIWSLSNTADGTTLADFEASAELTRPLLPGTYKAEVLRTSDEATAEITLSVTPDTATLIFLELPEYQPKASLTAPATAVAADTIEIDWTGPNARGDFLSTSELGTRAAKYITYANASKGTPARLRMPPEPGDYEIRYVWDGKVIAKTMIAVTPATATLVAPDTAPAGGHITVDWTGPNYKNDYISVARIGDRPSRYAAYTYTNKGAPLKLQMPAEPGDYEIRYVINGFNHIIARKPITVTDVSATLDVAETAVAGDTIVVNWSGPDYQNDYVSVSEVGSPDGRYKTYTYTRNGSPLRLKMPPEPGDYELRYVVNRGNRVLARKAISVAAVSAGLTTPATASAGDDIVVQWNGPDYQNDYISVAEAGAANGKYINYTYTRQGNPLRLKMPPQPGNYEIRYIQNQGNKVLASQPITVEAVGAALTLPDSAVAGAPLLVQWQGPDYKNDYISVAEVGSADGKYLGYTYTRQGSPLRLKLPLQPGDYEIRYVQNQKSTVLARHTLTVTPVTANLSAPDTALTGEPLLIQWDGPDYRNDYISVAETGSDQGRYINYVRTNKGSPLRLTMPGKPGTYELRYMAQGRPDTAIARRTVTVALAEATVALSGEAQAGEAALVTWTGPDFPNDYITVSRIGDTGYEAYTRTRGGSPLRLKMPTAPGSYELRYVLNEDNTVIARQQIEVK